MFWLKHSVIFIWLFTGLYSRVRRGHCRDVCEQGSKYAQIVSHVIIKSLLKTRHLEIYRDAAILSETASSARLCGLEEARSRISEELYALNIDIAIFRVSWTPELE